MAQQHNENQHSDKSATEAMINKNGGNSEEFDKVIHPENGIVLMDNTILKCFPKELPQEDVVPDVVSLDTSGEYLTIGNHRHKPDNPKSDIEESKAQQQLFIDNAFYLLGHRERIMQDSRMFLAPVEVQSGLAYSGTSGFRCPTIGVYLEWWATCAQAMHTDENGCRCMVYRLSGSPLSGSNKSSAVFEDGTTKIVGLSPFISYWSPFIKINTRYTEAKQTYQAYTLQEVLDILRREDGDDKSYLRNVKEFFMQQEIKLLKNRVARLEKESSEWYDKYQASLIKYNEAKLRKACEEYNSLKVDVDKETECLKEQKRCLKRELKAGRLDNISYQRKLIQLKKRIAEVSWTLQSMYITICREFGALGIGEGTLCKLFRQFENEENC